MRPSGSKCFGFGEGAAGGGEIVGDGEDVPALEVPGELMAILFGGEGDTLGDAFVVFDGTAEVDTAHGFDEDLEFLAFSDWREAETLFIAHTVDLSDIGGIDKDLGIVVTLVEGEHTFGGDLGQRGDIEHRAPALIHVFHGEQGGVHDETVGSEDDVSALREFEGRDGDHHGRGCRDGREGLLAVFLHHLAEFEEFLRGTAIFVDGGIVVVGGDIGCKTGRVGTGPVAKGGASVGHIEGETDVLGEHLVDSIDHVLGRAGLMVGTPFVEPAAPEFRAHQRGIRAELFEALELFIDVGTCTEVHGPDEVIETVEFEVGGPVALEKNGAVVF